MNLKKELQLMDLSDLRFVCRELGISCKGNKNHIIKKLLEPLNKDYKMNFFKKRNKEKVIEMTSYNKVIPNKQEARKAREARKKKRIKNKKIKKKAYEYTIQYLNKFDFDIKNVKEFSKSRRNIQNLLNILYQWYKFFNEEEKRVIKKSIIETIYYFYKNGSKFKDSDIQIYLRYFETLKKYIEK